MEDRQSNLVYRILRAYGIEPSQVRPPQKGYRNEAYPVMCDDGTMANLILYKREPGILDKIKAANAVSDYLHAQGFAARHTIDPRIIQLRAGSYRKYAALYAYLDGHTIPWEGYTQDHLKVVGKVMGDMHALLKNFTDYNLPDVADEYLDIVGRMKTYFSDAPAQRALSSKLLLQVRPEIFETFTQLLTGSKLLPGKQALHMDFVRSNLLFQEDDGEFKVKLSGVLDFEKTAYGHPLFDIARTLAFLLVDCKYKEPAKVRKYFLGGGYIKRGASTLPSKYMGMLDPLVDLFLFYDFYKFLRHNPYEALHDNEHFIRTVSLLIPRHLVVPTTSVARVA